MKIKGKSLLIGLLCFGIIFMITGCGNKQAITAEEFKSKMEDKGYTIQDTTSQFSSVDYIKKVYIALSSDSSYQIEFYELSNSDNASTMFNENKQGFENSKSSSSSETSASMGNYAKYTLTTNGKYKVVSRIENTVIYLNVPSSKKQIIKDILKELGY